MPRDRACWWAGALLIGLLLPRVGHAHFFVQPYTLPIPFWMYAWSSGAALVLSFVIVRLFSKVSPEPAPQHEAAAPVGAPPGALLLLARGVAVFLLVLCVVTGLAGNQNPFANINMTLFWIVFVLLVPYSVVIVGDYYAALNPWRGTVAIVEWAAGHRFEGRWKYPARWGYYPALVLYMIFIWLELFGELAPRGLAIALAAYALVNVLGAWLWGSRTWFRYGEFFGVMLQLLGKMAPLRWRTWDASGAASRWRAPFMGLLEKTESAGLSLSLFVLFMLASTAFDGLHSTMPWVKLFWQGLYPGVADWLPAISRRPMLLANQIYYAWQWLMMVLMPFIYLGVFYGFVHATRKLSNDTSLSTYALVPQFALTLVPIAFVYHVTHYFTLVASQAAQVYRLASDPFGFGWNLFGTAITVTRPYMIDVGVIWHVQVALILLGHIVSVYLAHVLAVRRFVNIRGAVLSQIPMLLLMVVFTAAGLWILSLPLVR